MTVMDAVIRNQERIDLRLFFNMGEPLFPSIRSQPDDLCCFLIKLFTQNNAVVIWIKTGFYSRSERILVWALSTLNLIKSLFWFLLSYEGTFYYRCFPHIYFTWAVCPGVVAADQVNLVTHLNILYFLSFILYRRQSRHNLIVFRQYRLNGNMMPARCKVRRTTALNLLESGLNLEASQQAEIKIKKTRF